jgi:PAS domain S-box-containing protein
LYWWQIVHPDDRETVEEAIATGVQAGSNSVEYRIVRPDGSIRWLLARGHVISDDAGQPVRIDGVTSDITTRKEAELASTQATALARAAVESATGGVIVTTLNGSPIMWNQRFCELWHTAPSADAHPTAWISETAQQCSGPGPEMYQQRIHQLLSEPDEESYDVLTLHSGQVIERYSSPYRVQGDLFGRLWSHRDITERRRMEQEVQQIRALLQAVVDNAPAAIYAKDLDGRYIISNSRIAPLLLGTRIDPLGLRDADMFSADTLSTIQPHDQQVISSRQPWIGEESFSAHDGTWHTFLSVKFPLLDEQGEFFAIGGISTDITERKRIEAALRTRDHILETINYLAQQLLTSTDDFDWNQALARFGNAVAVSRVYIFENSIGADGALRMSQRYEWCAPDIEPQIDNAELQNLDYQAGGFGRWASLLAQKEPIAGHVRDFPEREQAILAPQQIVSIIIVPIFVRGEWRGFIGFDQCDREREWQPSEIHALESAASLFGLAL